MQGAFGLFLVTLAPSDANKEYQRGLNAIVAAQMVHAMRIHTLAHPYSAADVCHAPHCPPAPLSYKNGICMQSCVHADFMVTVCNYAQQNCPLYACCAAACLANLQNCSMMIRDGVGQAGVQHLVLSTLEDSRPYTQDDDTFPAVCEFQGRQSKIPQRDAKGAIQVHS